MTVWSGNYEVYGARKVWQALRRKGITVARCTVERLMRRLAIAGVTRGKARRTTIAATDGVRAGDLVNRRFTANRPNALRVADFTYVPTRSGTVYVAFDAYFGRTLRTAAKGTRLARARALTTFFAFLELRHQVEIHALTGRVVQCAIDEMSRHAVRAIHRVLGL